MDDELQGAIDLVAQTLTIGIPCITAIRELRDACDRVIAEDEAETRAIVSGWCSEIFQP